MEMRFRDGDGGGKVREFANNSRTESDWIRAIRKRRLARVPGSGNVDEFRDVKLRKKIRGYTESFETIFDVQSRQSAQLAEPDF